MDILSVYCEVINFVNNKEITNSATLFGRGVCVVDPHGIWDAWNIVKIKYT